jgi:hypothetical protein
VGQTAPGGFKMNYPKREPFFAHKFVRLLTKSCAAQDIGLNAFSLLCVIAHQEDSARYSGPVRFWNEQLMNVLGFKSPKQLNDCRSKAIQFGWLSYERSGNREVGRYAVTIPESFEGLEDTQIEDNRSLNHSSIHAENGMSKERIAERLGDESRNESVTESGKPSIPNPIPNPNPESTHENNTARTDQCDQILLEFNSAFGLQCRMTPARRKALLARLKDDWWLKNWRESLSVGSQSEFLRGQNDRGWKIDFEFFLKPETVTKIIEGKYSDSTPKRKDPFPFDLSDPGSKARMEKIFLDNLHT